MSLMSAIIGGALYIVEGQIPYGFVWVPWDCTSFVIFFFTSLQEIIAMIIGTLINLATETTVLGFCIQTCAGFEILKHRLQKMIKLNTKEGALKSSLKNTSDKPSRLSKHVSHHLCIIRFVKREY